jgi:hypothetical protein
MIAAWIHTTLYVGMFTNHNHPFVKAHYVVRHPGTSSTQCT